MAQDSQTGYRAMRFRGREHPLPNRLDPAVYKDVTTDQCLAWLAGAGFDGHRTSDSAPLEVSFVLARRSQRGLDSGSRK